MILNNCEDVVMFWIKFGDKKMDVWKDKLELPKVDPEYSQA
jgi:hypothetical protein